MVTVTFTPNLQRHVSSPPRELTATTVADALQQIFAENQTLAGYILDDQHRLRKNITIFVDGTMIQDRNTLSDPLQPTSDVQVLQALSGG
ncbi:MAG TPA: MoaD/ThiS family protein [Saccharospirillum sp.]|nr:MoaD/ThiS family protein [Saccharospirillum sp.]